MAQRKKKIAQLPQQMLSAQMQLSQPRATETENENEKEAETEQVEPQIQQKEAPRLRSASLWGLC